MQTCFIKSHTAIIRVSMKEAENEKWVLSEVAALFQIS